MKPIIIYPCEFGNISKIDSDYKFEQEVAEEIGFRTVTFNYDNFVMGEKLKISNADNYSCDAIYRGWMLKAGAYKRLYNELSRVGISLITTPEQYEATHHFINSYTRLEKYTPKTIWYPELVSINWKEVRKKFDKFVVKDYVKSVKGFDFPEYLTSDMTDEELDSYIDKFKHLRGDLYTGGIVLKQYVELDKSNGHTHEFRAFYINGKARIMYANSDNSEDLIPGYSANQYNLESLRSNFYTIDFARLKNGEYTVIEIGDGQVSGIPSKEIAYKLYEQLYKSEF